MKFHSVLETGKAKAGAAYVEALRAAGHPGGNRVITEADAKRVPG